jgi:hypothetical protein
MYALKYGSHDVGPVASPVLKAHGVRLRFASVLTRVVVSLGRHADSGARRRIHSSSSARYAAAATLTPTDTTSPRNNDQALMFISAQKRMAVGTTDRNCRLLREHAGQTLNPRWFLRTAALLLPRLIVGGVMDVLHDRCAGLDIGKENLKAFGGDGRLLAGAYYLLEDTLNVMLVNAAHAKGLPGRKTDVSDCAWLAQLGECGLLKPSFVPPEPVRHLRDLTLYRTRYRTTLTVERTREAQRLEKELADAGD